MIMYFFAGDNIEPDNVAIHDNSPHCRDDIA